MHLGGINFYLLDFVKSCDNRVFRQADHFCVGPKIAPDIGGLAQRLELALVYLTNHRRCQKQLTSYIFLA